MKAEINETKMRRLELAEVIGNATGTHEEDVQRRRGFEGQLAMLRKRLSPIAYGALKAENEAYSGEVKQATLLVQESKLAEAKAASKAQQLKAQLSAQRRAAVAASKDAEKAQQESQRQLESVVAAASEDLEQAERQKEKAEEAIKKKCAVPWKDRSEEHEVLLRDCRQLQEEVIVTKAQREVLRQTLKAETTAARADQA
mmetsp:Transcript_137242/g.426487  ORF Transcript_137242/g.426487 Transcript_137242/m.426487 type:complete len:200 (+) Transcript_137242:942-1541(+)